MLGQFIARAIADHILPMSFLNCYKGRVDCDHARLARTPKKRKPLVTLIRSTLQKAPLAAPMFAFTLFEYDLRIPLILVTFIPLICGQVCHFSTNIQPFACVVAFAGWL